MNAKTEHIIIAILVIALLYYVYKHQSLLSDFLVLKNKIKQTKKVKINADQTYSPYPSIKKIFKFIIFLNPSSSF